MERAMAERTFTTGTGQPILRSGAEQAERGERLVGLGFRCWLSGYQAGTIQSWEHCWVHYCKELGSRDARIAMTDLSSWVNSVRCHALRDITLSAGNCASFCKDEKLAITLVAASTHGMCPALKACAAALLGTDKVEPVLKTSSQFAITLETVGIRFAPDFAQPETMVQAH
jgi:hypothetical protein